MFSFLAALINWSGRFNPIFLSTAFPISALSKVPIGSPASERTRNAKLLVLSAAGLPLGTLDRVDIGKAVLKKIGLNLPDQLIKIARKENIYPLGLNLFNIAQSMILSDSDEDQK